VVEKMIRLMFLSHQESERWDIWRDVRDGSAICTKKGKNPPRVSARAIGAASMGTTHCGT